MSYLGVPNFRYRTPQSRYLKEKTIKRFKMYIFGYIRGCGRYLKIRPDPSDFSAMTHINLHSTESNCLFITRERQSLDTHHTCMYMGVSFLTYYHYIILTKTKLNFIEKYIFHIVNLLMLKN